MFKRNRTRRIGTLAIMTATGLLAVSSYFTVFSDHFGAEGVVKASEIIETKNPLPESGKCGEDASYTFDPNTGTLVIQGTGSVGVTELFHDFSEREEIKRVIIEEGITELGSYLFFGDIHIESVSLPTTLVEIYTGTFYGLKDLKEITLPPHLDKLGDVAFAECEKIDKIILPDELRMIYSGAFSNTAIREIHIPAGVFEMEGALDGTFLLEKITVDPDNEHFVVIDNVLYRKDNRTRDNLWLIHYPLAASSRKQIVLPSSVTKICKASVRLQNNYLVVPEGVTRLYYDSILGDGSDYDNYVFILGQAVEYEENSVFHAKVCAYPDEIIHVFHDETQILPIYDADTVSAPAEGNVRLDVPESVGTQYIMRWMSGNEEILTVDSDGVVTSVGPGETDIFLVANKKECYRYRVTSGITSDPGNSGAASSGAVVPVAFVSLMGLSAAMVLLASGRKRI